MEHLVAISVLWVDREWSFLEVMRRRYGRAFRRMTVARGSRCALAALECDEYDLLVCSQRLDAWDGCDLVEYVHDRWPRTARILLTDVDELRGRERAPAGVVMARSSAADGLTTLLRGLVPRPDGPGGAGSPTI